MHLFFTWARETLAPVSERTKVLFLAELKELVVLGIPHEKISLFEVKFVAGVDVEIVLSEAVGGYERRSDQVGVRELGLGGNAGHVEKRKGTVLEIS